MQEGLATRRPLSYSCGMPSHASPLRSSRRSTPGAQLARALRRSTSADDVLATAARAVGAGRRPKAVALAVVRHAGALDARVLRSALSHVGAWDAVDRLCRNPALHSEATRHALEEVAAEAWADTWWGAGRRPAYGEMLLTAMGCAGLLTRAQHPRLVDRLLEACIAPIGNATAPMGSVRRHRQRVRMALRVLVEVKDLPEETLMALENVAGRNDADARRCLALHRGAAARLWRQQLRRFTWFVPGAILVAVARRWPTVDGEDQTVAAQARAAAIRGGHWDALVEECLATCPVGFAVRYRALEAPDACEVFAQASDEQLLTLERTDLVYPFASEDSAVRERAFLLLHRL